MILLHRAQAAALIMAASFAPWSLATAQRATVDDAQPAMRIPRLPLVYPKGIGPTVAKPEPDTRAAFFRQLRERAVAERARSGEAVAAQRPAAATSAPPAVSAPASGPSAAPAPARGARSVPPSTQVGVQGGQQGQRAVTGPTGRVIGRVVDAVSGRPIQGAQVVIVGYRTGGVSDLDGRYEIARAPVGSQTILFRLIGYRPVRFDSVQVAEGSAVTVNAALEVAASQIAGVTVTAEVPRRADSDVGLLAMQRNAPSVSDGISSASMSRAPTSNAADAIVRVPGVSVVNNRFVVVRGLGERYSNTLLNGSELASPEPTRKVVPLDIFPAKLLESVVTTKTATPDKPGDFAGGLVEVKTKEFPEELTAQVSVGQTWHTLTTGSSGPFPERQWADYLANGTSIRPVPTGAPALGTVSDRFAQAFRSRWVPGSVQAAPNTAAELTIGGQTKLFGQPLGLIFAGTYALERKRVPDRVFQFIFNETAVQRAYTFDEFTSNTDASGLLNVSYRPASWTKLGWKNLITRSGEDQAIEATGFDSERSDGSIVAYQRGYVQRDLLQSQLSGEHTLGFLRDLRVDWRVSYTRAKRDEPDNRQAPYAKTPESSTFTLTYAFVPRAQVRFLEDRTPAAQVDFSLPFSWGRRDDALFKTGVLYRERQRAFDASLFFYEPGVRPDGSQRFTDPLLSLPPDQLFAPENMGRNALVSLLQINDRAGPYRSTERVQAAFGMLDVPVWSWLRIVAGARYEGWTLRLLTNPTDTDTLRRRTTERDQPDLLPSANVTVKVGDRTNIRLAAFESVTRPDPRDIAPDVYNPVFGECDQVGTFNLQRARTLNLDARWEFYPDFGEIVSFSAFYKRFASAIVETIGASAGNQCTIGLANAEDAINVGGEFELRQTIARKWQVALNFTAVQSRVRLPRFLGVYPADLPLQSQAPFLVNASVGWGEPTDRVQSTVLLNWFADRVARYGAAPPSPAGTPDSLLAAPAPNAIERGRATLDAKVDLRVMRGIVASLSARNLLNQPIRIVQTTDELGERINSYIDQGRFFALKVSYDLFR